MYSKAELDRLNAEKKRLQEPKPPQPRPSPSGTMQPGANRVDQKVLQGRLEAIDKRRDEIERGLGSYKNIARDNFHER